MLKHVEAAVARGWAVIPLHRITDDGTCSCGLGTDCKSAGKHPMHNGWRTDPPMSAEARRRTWDVLHPPNYGVITGSGLLVVDEDPDKGGNIMELLADLDDDAEALLSSFIVRTGSGGRHFYLALPEGEVLGNSANRLANGIDTRADGGYVVGPGSVSSKGAYTVDSAADILPAPDDLLARLRTSVRPDAATAVVPMAAADINPVRRSYVERGIERELDRLRTMQAGAFSGGEWGSQYRGEPWDGGCYGVACNLIELANTGVVELEAVHQAYLAAAPTDKDFAWGNHEEKWRSALKKVGANARDLTRVGLHAANQQTAADVEWSQDAEEEQTRTDDLARRVSVKLGDRDDREVFDEIVAGMLAYDEGDPRIFRAGDELVRLDVRSWRLVPLGVASLRLEIASRVAFYVMRQVKDPDDPKEKVWKAFPASLPKHVLEMLIASPPLDFPECAAVSHTGFFTPEGQWWDRRGYCAEASTYCTARVESGPIPDHPGSADVENALRILAEPIAGFPFARDENSSRTHALALLLLPFVRPMIDGPTPLHLVSAPAAGTGKTKLAEALLYPACGEVAINDTPRRQEEVVKTVFSVLRNNPRALILDNIPEDSTLGAGELASMLTSYPVHGGRVLGVSQIAVVPTTCAWVATGNNPAYTNELARRIITIELDAQENVLDRSFAIDDLSGWLRDRRGRLIAAAATVVRAWLVAGRPAYSGRRLASFESWSLVVGGICEHAGLRGFMANQRDVSQRNDVQTSALSNFLAAWDHLPDARQSTDALLTLMEEHDIDFPSVRGGDRQGRKVSLGRHLTRTMVGRHLPGGYTVDATRMPGTGRGAFVLVRKPNVARLDDHRPPVGAVDQA